METAKTELILVYNAKSGFFNLTKDTLHKILFPSTYQCNLCALTYGTIRMRPEWKGFIDRLRITPRFLHRDEFLEMLETHPHNIDNTEFPAIFLSKSGVIDLLATSKEINECKNLKNLMDLISEKLASTQ